MTALYVFQLVFCSNKVPLHVYGKTNCLSTFIIRYFLHLQGLN